MSSPSAQCLRCSRRTTTAQVRYPPSWIQHRSKPPSIAWLVGKLLASRADSAIDDVANAWATSVSSRSVTYRQAMLLCLCFEMTGALAVGARTASTIKNGMLVASTN